MKVFMTKTNYIPVDCRAITPYLTVPDVAKLVEFLKQAFDGVEGHKFVRPNGTVLHAQVRVADSLLMIGEPQAPWKPRPTTLYFYVPDVDAVYRRAIAAGATSVSEPADMFYGDRHACVTDVGGNDWWIATHLEDLSPEEIQSRAAAFYQQRAKPLG